jgi:hypothetical protein
MIATTSARRLALVLVALGALTASPSAHEFWLEPTSFVPATGKIIGIRARVGDGVLGDPVPRDPSLLAELIVDSGSGRSPVVGQDGADPAGLLRIASNNLYVIGYLGKPTPVELPAGKFDTYLHDEGLTDVIAARQKKGATAAGARELFTRCAKTLVLAGPVLPSQHDRVLGFPLELIAETNPYAPGSSGEVRVRLLYHGKPLKGALITAIRRRNGERLSVRSDAAGRARFALPADGAWLIKSVHMLAAPAGSPADWVSYWASLTFELPAQQPSDSTR